MENLGNVNSSPVRFLGHSTLSLLNCKFVQPSKRGFFYQLWRRKGHFSNLSNNIIVLKKSSGCCFCFNLRDRDTWQYFMELIVWWWCLRVGSTLPLWWNCLYWIEASKSRAMLRTACYEQCGSRVLDLARLRQFLNFTLIIIIVIGT